MENSNQYICKQFPVWCKVIGPFRNLLHLSKYENTVNGLDKPEYWKTISMNLKLNQYREVSISKKVRAWFPRKERQNLVLTCQYSPRAKRRGPTHLELHKPSWIIHLHAGRARLWREYQIMNNMHTSPRQASSYFHDSPMTAFCYTDVSTAISSHPLVGARCTSRTPLITAIVNPKFAIHSYGKILTYDIPHNDIYQCFRPRKSNFCTQRSTNFTHDYTCDAFYPVIKISGESGCWELPQRPHSHGLWNKSQNPYPLRSRIIFNLATIDAQ